jgi:hypothetical protein
MAQFEELREKIGNGTLELSDLDDLRNTAKTDEEKIAVAVLADKVQHGKVDGYDLELLAAAYPEKRVEKRVEKLEEATPTPAPPAPRPTAESRQNPVRDDAPGSK